MQKPDPQTTLEDLVREWRDARQAWFDLSQEEFKSDHTKGRESVLNRCSETEDALMKFARTI